MEKDREKNKSSIVGQIFAEIGVMIAAGAGIYALSRLQGWRTEICLRNLVFAVLGIGIVGFHWRQALILDNLDYDNKNHRMRFWAVFLICLAVSFACSFLPVEGWPFLVIYVVLSLFTNLSTGILSASVLLIFPVLTAEADPGVFFLYFICGVFAATLFRHLEEGFRVGIPLFLSMLCLILCLTAGTVLTAKDRPDLEMLVMPLANVILSSILLLGCLKLFSAIVVFRDRERYLELNDTENPILTALKNDSRDEYFLAVHTAYFCERIADELGLETDAMKCAGYYHRLKQLQEMVDRKQFPDWAGEILTEYLHKQNRPLKKETAVLLCSDMIMSSIQSMMRQNNGKAIDFDGLIDTVFRKLMESGVFKECDISIRELNLMQNKFKEEKLYYELLR